MGVSWLTFLEVTAYFKRHTTGSHCWLTTIITGNLCHIRAASFVLLSESSSVIRAAGVQILRDQRKNDASFTFPNGSRGRKLPQICILLHLISTLSDVYLGTMSQGKEPMVISRSGPTYINHFVAETPININCVTGTIVCTYQTVSIDFEIRGTRIKQIAKYRTRIFNLQYSQ